MHLLLGVCHVVTEPERLPGSLQDPLQAGCTPVVLAVRNNLLGCLV